MFSGTELRENLYEVKSVFPELSDLKIIGTDSYNFIRSEIQEELNNNSFSKKQLANLFNHLRKESGDKVIPFLYEKEKHAAAYLAIKYKEKVYVLPLHGEGKDGNVISLLVPEGVKVLKISSKVRYQNKEGILKVMELCSQRTQSGCFVLAILGLQAAMERGIKGLEIDKQIDEINLTGDKMIILPRFMAHIFQDPTFAFVATTAPEIVPILKSDEMKENISKMIEEEGINCEWIYDFTVDGSRYLSTSYLKFNEKLLEIVKMANEIPRTKENAFPENMSLNRANNSYGSNPKNEYQVKASGILEEKVESKISCSCFSWINPFRRRQRAKAAKISPLQIT
jgi:hypothetical protein